MKNSKEYNKKYYDTHKENNHLSQVQCDVCNKCVCLLSLKKHKLSIKCQFENLKKSQKQE